MSPLSFGPPTKLLLTFGAATVLIILALFLEVSGIAIGAMLVLLGVVTRIAWRRVCSPGDAFLAGACGLIIFCDTLWSDSWVHIDSYFAGIAVGLAGTVLLAARKLPASKTRTAWLIVGTIWALAAAGLLMAAGYLMNVSDLFYPGIIALMIVLILVKFTFRLSIGLVQVVNTLILVLVGLPIVDWATRPSYQLEPRPDVRKRLYSYVEARKDPTAFANWWNYFVTEWRDTMQDICIPGTNITVPFYLRSGADGMMFESRIHINQLGFRGPEISADKGNAYRIVAIGESTTFGHTLYADDVPWPTVLESIINERLKPNRPVQVINAGVPSYTLFINLERLEDRLLSLQPDMIISYHGYNGFDTLIPTLPAVTGQGPPEYEERPIKLLADAEYRLKVMAYRWKRSQPARTNGAEVVLMESIYAAGYRHLIELTRTNGIELALANYSMAVNTNSEPDVVAFYRAVFPRILDQIRANEMHSEIVKTLATGRPGVTHVNTHPRLDGQYDKFIDLVHFTQPGRQEMAEAMFESIRPVLEKELR